MARQDNALRLVIVDDSVEDAEAIVSGLRNAGIAVRPLRPATLEELDAALGGQPIDLVLAAQRPGALPLAEVAQRVLASGKDIPLMAVVESIDEVGFLAALSLGARRIGPAGGDRRHRRGHRWPALP